MTEIKYKIFDKIEAIGSPSWEALFGDPAEGYSFYKSVEESLLEGFSFSYLAIYKDSRLAVIAPLFCADFDLAIAADGFWEKLIKSARIFMPRFLICKTFFCGAPFSESGVLGACAGALEDPAIRRVLLKAIEKQAAGHHASLILFKDFLEKDALVLNYLRSFGFTKVSSYPAVDVSLNFKSFEEYLQSLGKSTRKNLKKKLQKSSEQGEIQVRLVDDIRPEIDKIMQLYENTYQAGSTKFERLNWEFFLRVNRQFSCARFFLYYFQDKLVAFNLCFSHKNILIDKFIGLDYAVSNRLNLYFVSWAHNIKWCIEHQINAYYPGQTDYEPKIRLGGKLIPLYAYLKHRRLVANFMIKILALFFKPDNFDKNLRS